MSGNSGLRPYDGAVTEPDSAPVAAGTGPVRRVFATPPPRLDASLNRVGITAGRRVPVALFVWVLGVLLIWWAGQWPGLLSPDSIRYVIHVTSGPWTADHSVLYDSGVLGSLKLTKSVGLLTFVQCVCAAAIVSYFVSAMRKFGVPTKWAVIPALILPLVPSFGAFVNTVWKDVPFAFCELLIAATTLRLLTVRRDPEATPRSYRGLLIALGFEFLGLVLFRNDGFIVLVVLVIALVIGFSRIRLRILGLGVAALLGLVFASTVVYPAIGVKPANSSLAYGTFYGDIAVAYAEAPKTFTKSDLTLMKKVAPLSVWRHANNCYDSDPLFTPKSFNRAEADKLKNSLASLWVRTLTRTPITVIRTRLCRSAVAWSPLPPPRDRAALSETPLQTPKTLYGRAALLPAKVVPHLRAQPLSTKLSKLTHWARVAVHGGYWQPFLWRGATWSYLAYIALALASVRRKRWDVMLAGAVCLANQLTVMAANPAQLYRYMAGPIFVGMLLVPIALVVRGDDRSKPEQAPAEREPDAEAEPMVSSAD